MHRKIFGIMVLLVLALTAMPVALAQPGSDKIEARLLDQFRTEGQAGFIVRFADQADLSPAYTMGWEERGWFVVNTLQAAAAKSQAGAIAYLDSLGLYHETYIAGNDLYVRDGNLDVATDLAARAEVDSIRALRTYYVDPVLSQAPTAPAGPDALAWGINYTDADLFWPEWGQGINIVVANIDTGVQWNHPALDQAFNCGSDPTDAACWADPANICGGSACDNNGHGSHTMGTMVADDDPSLTWQAGMAPDAKWIACKGCETNSCSEASLNACADWILQPDGNPANRPHVVNNSWGGGSGDPWYLAKVNAWRAAGVFPAFSAGNSGSSCSTIGDPGSYQESFASAAHDSSGNIASFSSRGPSPFGHDPYTKPNIAAPGVSVCSTVPTNAWSCGYSGTSMASPHTAGAVALLWSCNPDLVGEIDTTFQALQNTVNPAPAGNCGAPPDGEGNYTFGYGYLNIFNTGLLYCGEAGTGWLDGHVTDAGTGNPISGANVSAVPGLEGGAIQAVTDPTGYYTMTLPAGIYDVTASATGYASQTAQDVEVVTDTVTTQDFALAYMGEWTIATQPTCFDWTRLDAEYFPATGKVYILGGRSDTNTLGDIYAFDPVANTCTDTGANMPNPISNYTINLVNNGTADVLCTFGGRQSDGTVTLNVQCYDPIANTASVVTNLPAGYTGFTPGGQAVVDNMVYVFGGFNSLASPYETARTDRYDPVANTFTQVGDLTLARSYLMPAVVDGVLYTFGGTVFDGAALNAQTRTELMADPGGAGTWDDVAVADMPNAGAEGRGYGFDSDSIFGLMNQIVLAPYNAQWSGSSLDVALYDIASDSYDTSYPDLNVSRRDHAGVFVPLCTEDPDDGLPGMWVIGGYAGADTPPYGSPEYYPLACAVAGPPEAAFSSDSPVCLGEAMNFFDETTANPPVDAWFWDFGDGVGTSTDTDPTYTYLAAGDYDVTLVVTNTEGSDSVTGTVTVNPTPEAAFVYDPAAGLMPLTVYFTNTSLYAENPSWDFGDGNMGAGDTISHTYDFTGTYYVTLTVDSMYGCGTAEAYGVVTVVFESAPIADFSADPMMGCGAPLDVQFTDLSFAEPPVDAWFWDFGDGETSTETNPLHTYAATGDYVVTLLVTNTLGSDSITDTISVYDLPMATFDYAPTYGYMPLVVTFTNTSSYADTPVWDFGDGNYGAGDVVTHSYDMTGTFTVVLTVTSPYGCGEATAQADVMVYAPGECIPVSIVAVNQTPDGCVVDFDAELIGDEPFTYAWDFGTFGAFTTSTALVDFLATGTYTGTLDVTNCDGAGHDMEDIVVTVTCEPPTEFKVYLPLIVK